MNRPLSVGIVSEVFLIAAFLLVALGSYVAATNQVQTISCGLLGCAGYADLFEWQFFYLALGLLAASAMGFVSVLKSIHRSAARNDKAN
jgi:hypothetical protein